MTRTEAITEELLAAVDDPDQLPTIFERYAGSKGPLYNALAAATKRLREEFIELADRVQKLRQQQAELDRQLDDLDRQARQRHEVLQQAEQRLTEGRPLLDRLDRLAALGFGPADLDRLVELLSRMAADRGLPAQEGVQQFFETVACYEQVLSLDLEVRRATVRAQTAQAEAERWEAEARRVEAKAKLRREAIDFAEALLKRGVSADELAAWQRIVDRSGLPPAKLASALEQYASLSRLIRALEQERNRLQNQKEALEAGLAALRRRQAQLDEALQVISESGRQRLRQAEAEAARAVRDVQQLAVAAIRQAREEAVRTLAGWDQRLASTIERYEALAQEVVTMEQDVKLARALRTDTEEAWKRVAPRTWAALIRRMIRWAQVAGFNPRAVIPETVKAMKQGSLDYPALYGELSLPLVGLALWLSQALTEAEGVAASSART